MTRKIDKRPLYVRRIDAERAMAQAELNAVLEGLRDLRRYLNSPKFRAPSDRQNLVNVEDVLSRLNETTYAGVVASDHAFLTAVESQPKEPWPT